jgi:hypothetical protein
MNLIEYPPLPKQIGKLTFPAIAGNWDHSAKTLQQINRAIASRLTEEKIIVAVAGSLGRMDASFGISDFDYLLLLDDESIDGNAIDAKLREVAAELNLPPPNPHGAFVKPIGVEELIRRTGSPDEDVATMAKRLLLLMESKPVYNEAGFKNVIERILAKYLGRVTQDHSKEALFLLNDTIRYFRAICVNYEFSFFKENEKWGLRYVKLLHSRVIMYAGLLFLTLNSSKYGDKPKYIRQHIEKTPLEKILHVYEDNSDRAYAHLLGLYNLFIARMNEPIQRTQLSVEFEDRHSAPVYRELRVTGDALRKELMRFLSARRGTWTDNVFEYLVF